MASHEIEHCVDLVRNFILRREVSEGRAFILSVEEPVLQSLDVSLACASFYVEFGHPKWGEESLDTAGFKELVFGGGALFDERIACMALLWAQIKKSRYCDYEESFALARQIENIYVHLKSEYFDNNPSQALKLDRIRRQSALWTAQKPEDYDDEETPISDFRVFIEIWLFDIYFDQTEGGSASTADVNKKLRARLPPLITFLRSRRREAMEGNCMFVVDVHLILPNPIQAADFLLEYLDSVKGEKYVVYKAAATSRLVQYLIRSRPDAARLYLDESQKLFAKLGCLSHLADIDFVRIRDFQGTTHSVANRIDQLCKPTRHYRALKDLGTQLRVVRLAIDLVTGDLWKKIEPIVNEVEMDLQSAGDIFKLLVTRVVKLRTLSRHLQSSDDARWALEECLYTHHKLTPDLYGAVYHALYQCYFTLGDFDLAVKFAEMETKSKVAMEQKHRMSDAIYHLADARRSQIERCMELLSTRETQARQILIDSLSLSDLARQLEDWADWDVSAGRTISLPEFRHFPLPRAHVTNCYINSGRAQAWLSPSHQKSSTFNEEAEKATLPSQGSQICSHQIVNKEYSIRNVKIFIALLGPLK